MATKRTRSTKSKKTTRPSKRAPATASGPKRGILARYPWKEEPNPYFELRRSKIQGTGAFAIRNIKKGSRIVEYLCQRILWRATDNRYVDESIERHSPIL